MKLGFHYHIPAFSKDGLIYTSGFLGLFLDSISNHVEELVCFMHTPLPSEMFLMDYALKGKNIRLTSMGPHTSVPNRLIHSSGIVRQVLPDLEGLDILLVRSPTPLLPALGKVKKLSKSLLIVGDYNKSAKDLHLPFFRHKAVQVWAAFNKWQQNKIVENALVFVNNGLIYNELVGKIKNLHQIKTTTLQPSDFFFREDTCQSDTINILYTGRLDLSKGLIEMIESLSLLRQSGINAFLHFVGWEEKNATIVLDILKRHSNKLSLANYVVFHGKKKVGAELNSFYRMADIYVIGSKENEGFPRTIWEAFANSTPVVASAVGSIPIFLRDGVDAILIKPSSVGEMTDAIVRLIKDGNLRRSIICLAHEAARENTLEKQARIMINIMDNYLRTLA
jgi:glycosyltransferase involved in cell wall biosynthesis